MEKLKETFDYIKKNYDTFTDDEKIAIVNRLIEFNEMLKSKLNR